MSRDLLTVEDLTVAAAAAAGTGDDRAWGKAILSAVEDHAHERTTHRDPIENPGDPLLLHFLRSTAEALAAVPSTPYDGLMEAPAVIAETYQAHGELLSARKHAYLGALHDLLTDLADRIVRDAVPGLTWREIERTRPTAVITTPIEVDEVAQELENRRPIRSAEPRPYRA